MENHIRVNTKQELIDIITKNREKILSYGVLKIGIFGSFARDEASQNSDIDIYVEIDKKFKTLKNFIGLADALEEMTGRNVELVTPESISKYIGPHILKEINYVPLAA